MLQYLFTPEAFLPDGVGFALFSPPHLLWLAALAVLAAAMVVAYGRMPARRRLRFAWAVAVGLLCAEIARDVYLIARGAWLWKYTPLHMCSFTMFLMLGWCKKPARWVGQVLYGLGLPGALMALIFCDWADQPLWQFQTIYSFAFHGLLVGWLLMVLLGGDIRPQGRGLWDCVLFLCVAVPATAVVNHLLPGCNFFFTYAGSAGSPLAALIALLGRPWWLFAYAALVFAALALLFLPWALLQRRHQTERVRCRRLSRR